MNEEDIAVFTDGSLTHNGTGADVFSEILNVKESCRLNDEYSLLQMKIMAMEVTTKIPHNRGETNRSVAIYTPNVAEMGDPRSSRGNCWGWI